MRVPFLSVFLALIMLCPGLSGIAAATNIPASCDPQFYTVLSARSWLEGKREMEAAQFFLLKADSVLEYSCFDEEMRWLGRVADTMFSDNMTSTALFNNPALSFSPQDSFQPTITSPTGPNPPGGMSNRTLDDMLQLLILDVMNAYISNNFGHTLGGGVIPDSTGFCDDMNYVWRAMKCSNFQTNYFVTFAELEASDPRQQPAACNEPNRATKWQNIGRAAFPDPATPYANGGMDALVTYNTMIMTDPGTCTHAPIPTGIIIDEDGTSGPQAAHEDKVCPTPGCYYDHTANDCKP
ncbi:MAG: hypothetical protein R3D66_03235 [Alphaproteobacteria bacterium]